MSSLNSDLTLVAEKAHTIFMENANLCIQDDSTLAISQSLLTARAATNFTEFFECKNGLPLHCRFDRFALGIGRKNRDSFKQLHVSIGRPAQQSVAADRLRMWEMAYILYTTLTQEQAAVYSSQEIKALFNGLQDPRFHMKNKTNGAWATERALFIGLDIPSIRTSARQMIQSQQAGDKKDELGALLTNGYQGLVEKYSSIAAKRVSTAVDMFRTGKESLKTDLLELDQLYSLEIGGFGAHVNLDTDLPSGIEGPISHFDKDKDIMCFADDRNIFALNRDAQGWRKTKFVRKLIPFVNEKSLSLMLIIIAHCKKNLSWNTVLDAKIISTLLGDGTIYRIGYGTNGTIRLLGTYSCDDVLAACDADPDPALGFGFIYQLFCTTKKRKHLW